MFNVSLLYVDPLFIGSHGTRLLQINFLLYAVCLNEELDQISLHLGNVVNVKMLAVTIIIIFHALEENLHSKCAVYFIHSTMIQQ